MEVWVMYFWEVGELKVADLERIYRIAPVATDCTVGRLTDGLAARVRQKYGAAGGASGQLPLQPVEPMRSGSPFNTRFR